PAPIKVGTASPSRRKVRSVPSHRRTRRRVVRSLALTGVVALTAAACAPADQHPSEPGLGVDVGFLPTERGLTDRVDGIIDLWNGAWIAALFVGVVVWGLTIWCVLAYR